MNCIVYRSRRVADLYVFAREDLALEALPEELRRLTGALEVAMTLELHPERRLARSDPAAVQAALTSEGYYVQMPDNLASHGSHNAA